MNAFTHTHKVQCCEEISFPYVRFLQSLQYHFCISCLITFLSTYCCSNGKIMSSMYLITSCILDNSHQQQLHHPTSITSVSVTSSSLGTSLLYEALSRSFLLVVFSFHGSISSFFFLDFLKIIDWSSSTINSSFCTLSRNSLFSSFKEVFSAFNFLTCFFNFLFLSTCVAYIFSRLFNLINLVFTAS